jgi:hypothetical protein
MQKIKHKDPAVLMAYWQCGTRGCLASLLLGAGFIMIVLFEFGSGVYYTGIFLQISGHVYLAALSRSIRRLYSHAIRQW